jgi:peptidoglycan/LPS O-acetylase OafA/YrhL
MFSMSDTASSGYRRDIDGLRAVAVAAVLLFHAFPGRLPGGFVGVDIFFVISGFLISGIIFDGLERGSFSFVEFYSRRVRRIFPALVLVSAACLLFGWFSLMPAQFSRLGLHALGGATFSSNFILLNESGYFDTDSALKPLRHLWSLGIEEQYYLVWPAMLFLVRKRDRATAILLVTVALISFASNLYLTRVDQSMAYYLPLTRFWELMMGCGLAYMSRRGATGVLCIPGRWHLSSRYLPHAARLANIKVILGVIAIVLALFLINERRDFPGWWAVLACAGTALVISAGPHAWINERVLGSAIFVRVGLISYPLYLWHWPLLSFANVMTAKPSFAYRITAVVASVVLAWLTYEFLELPVRRGGTRPQKRRVTLRFVESMALVAFVGAIVGLNILRSVSAGDRRIAAISEATTDWESTDNEIVPGSVANSVLFLGDSNMEQYWPRVEALTQKYASRRSVEFRTMGGCAPIPEIERAHKHCADFVRAGFESAARSDVDIVVLAARWTGLGTNNDYYRLGTQHPASLDFLAPENAEVFDQFAATVAHLRHLGKRVIVVLSSLHGDAFDPNSMVDHSRLIPHARQVQAVTRAELLREFFPIDSRIRIAAENGGAEVLDPLDWFCSGTMCPVLDSRDRPLCKDGTHMRASVVRTRVTAFDQFVVIGPPTSKVLLESD